MSLIEFDVWTAPYDLSAAPDARLSTDDSLTDAGFNPVLYGEGDGFLEIHIDHPDTQYLQRRAFVRAVRTDTEEPIFDFILEEADTKILAKDSADKVIRWSGRGALYLLDRYRLGQAVYAPDQPNRGSVSIIDYWTWLNISPGGILRRVWEEGFHHPDAFYANTSVDFTRVTDSQDETWVDVTDYQTRIGTSGLQVVADMMRMGLMVRARPIPDSVQFQAFKDLSFRTDRTSATFTDGKVRFEGGVNVAVELPQKIAALRERTHTLTRRKDGQYATETLNGSGEPYMDFREVPFTSDPDAVEAFVGAHHLNLQKQSLVAVVQHRIGPVVLGIGSEFGYFPSINGDYWPGDLVTVHTGSGEYDLNEQALEVAGIRYFLRGADWMMECQLGAQSISANGLPALPAAGPSTVVTPQLQLCQADVESTVTDVPLIDWDWESGDESTPAWATINQAAGEGVVVDNFDAFSGGNYGFFDNTGANSSMPPGPTNAALVPVTPGDTIEITWRSRKNSTGFACLGIAWLTDDFTDWDATGRAGFVDSEEIVKTWTQGSAFQNHTEQVTVPAGVTAMYLNSNGGGTTSTWQLHDLLVTLLGVTSGESFDGDGPEELVGTGPRAARCDHNHLLENLLTEETDTALVPHPDGSGGVEWGTDATGVGGGLPWFNVTDYGATGDGVTDDLDAINDAIAALNTAGRGVLYFPAGNYLVSAGLDSVTANATIRGDGHGGGGRDMTEYVSRITCSDGGVTLFTIANDVYAFEALNLQCSDSTPTAGAGIAVTTGGDHGRFRDLTVDGFYINIDIQEGAEWSMTGCILQGPALYALKIRHVDLPDAGDWSISDSQFIANNRDADAAIQWESGGGGKISNVKINGGASDRFIDGISFAFADGVQSSVFTLTGCSIENVSGNAIEMTTTGTGRFGMIAIAGLQVGLYGNDAGRVFKATAATNGSYPANGSLGVITLDGIVAHTDGTARAAVELTNTDSVWLGSMALDGFNARYTSSGVTTLIDQAATANGRVSRTAGDLTGKNSTTFTNLDASLSITITTGARPVLLGVMCTAAITTAPQSICLDVTLDGTRLGQTFGLQAVDANHSAKAVNPGFTFLTGALAVGSHTFVLQYRVTGSSATFYASTGVTPLVFWVAEQPV